MKRAILWLLVVGWFVTACAPAATGGQPSAAQPPPQAPVTLVAAVRYEPQSLAARAITPAGAAFYLTRRMFNADLAILDDQGNPQPYLAESLPQLNSDSWKVAADGTMETTYRLRPNLAWHDGTALKADDFVFSRSLYGAPWVGTASGPPISLIQDVAAPDDRTIIIQWKQPYAAAGALQSLGTGPGGLPPLPRSILGSALDSGSLETLVNHPYWTTAFVGLGPYKLEQWEPGAFIETSAFALHATGAPKIGHIKMQFTPDPNTGLATMLAGEIQFAADSAVGPSQTVTLLREMPSGTVSTVFYASQWRAIHFQGRSEFLSPSTLQDRRLRKALAFAIDRSALDDVVWNGQLPLANIMFSATSELGRAADAAVAKYTFDLRQSAQLMAEAGYTRSGDAPYASSSGRFSAELKANSGPENEVEMSGIASSWRQAGFDVQEAVLPVAQIQNVQVRATYPAMFIYSYTVGESALALVSSDNIPRPDNNWRGSSFDGYANPEMDRLISAFNAALAPSDRARVAADIARLYGEELPSISLFFGGQPWVFTSHLTGPKPVAPESNVGWDLQTWEFR